MADRDFLLEFGSFQELLASCASRLSEEGVYFDTTEAGEIGSDVAFEVRVRDSFSVLRGDGEIVGATEEGVFVRLAYLDQPSLKLLPRLVEHYRRHGIPLLELPEVEEIMEPEKTAEVQEPTVDDLWPEEEAAAPVEPAGLTLDDLEAEFLTDDDPDEPESEPGIEQEAAQGTLLVDATAASIPEEPAKEAEVDPEVEPVLVDPEELIADSRESEEDLAANDIHLDELMTSEEPSPIAMPETAPVMEEIEIDSGVPWLPDESEKKSGRGLWVILLCVVLGAALGAAVYFFFLRPKEESSRIPASPAEIQARAVPAAQPAIEPTPMTTDPVEPPLEDRIATAQQGGGSAELALVASRPQPAAPPTEILTGVNRITWIDESDETIITLWGDGLFVAEQVDDFRVVGGAPREVVRIRGIRRPFAQQQIDLDTDHVRRIRIGLHQEADGVALHFVADLVDGDVELLRTEAAGEQLRVYFSKAG